MPRDPDRVRLRHMLRAAREAIEGANGRTRVDLDADRSLQHTLVRCIEVVGEAAARVSTDFRRAHPDLSWDRMIGMRNRLIHAYFNINLNIVWRTATEELPVLVERLAMILSEEGDP